MLLTFDPKKLWLYPYFQRCIQGRPTPLLSPPPPPIPQPKQALQDQKNYLQGRALHLIIATHHPLSIKSGPITAHSTFTVRNICIFASQIQRNYNVSYIIQNDGIDPMDEFMKLLKTLYTFTVPLCSTVQHLLGALSLQSVTSSLVLFTSCKLIKKSLISGR